VNPVRACLAMAHRRVPLGLITESVESCGSVTRAPKLQFA
jgi:hypothetical protein